MNLWKVSTVALTLALGVVAGGSMVATASADEQPHMKTALDHLKAAKGALDAAERDKGGHREKASKLTEQAIHEVEAGIDFADKHPDPKGGGGPGPKGGGPRPKGGGPAPKG